MSEFEYPPFPAFTMPNPFGEQVLVAGARVHRVDEEGGVQLFCYTLGESWYFNAGADHVKAWAARVGDFVTIRVTLGQLAEPKP